MDSTLAARGMWWLPTAPTWPAVTYGAGGGDSCAPCGGESPHPSGLLWGSSTGEGERLLITTVAVGFPTGAGGGESGFSYSALG